jgi:hypothetical protein
MISRSLEVSIAGPRRPRNCTPDPAAAPAYRAPAATGTNFWIRFACSTSPV